MMILFFSVVVCNVCVAQADTLIKKLDSLRTTSTDSSSGKQFDIHKTAYTERTKINVPVYFILLGTDFVQEVTGPFHSTGKTWRKVAGFGVIEGGLFLADKSIQSSVSGFMQRNPGLKNVSSYVTNFGGDWETYTLAAFGLYGWVFKNNKIKTTTLLATQSYLVAGQVQFLVKLLTGEQRPSYEDPNHAAPAPIFHGPSFSFKNGTSNVAFPSGHTTAAFAAATVFAEEYRDHPIIPIIAYSAATLIGLSRITENAHWATDVFAGAALGYVTGLQVVRNYHRYAYLQNHKQAPAKISFGSQYNFDHVEPSLVIQFR